jgi:hypothetical protein
MSGSDRNPLPEQVTSLFEELPVENLEQVASLVEFEEKDEQEGGEGKGGRSSREGCGPGGLGEKGGADSDGPAPVPGASSSDQR